MQLKHQLSTMDDKNIGTLRGSTTWGLEDLPPSFLQYQVCKLSKVEEDKFRDHVGFW